MSHPLPQALEPPRKAATVWVEMFNGHHKRLPVYGLTRVKTWRHTALWRDYDQYTDRWFGVAYVNGELRAVSGLRVRGRHDPASPPRVMRCIRGYRDPWLNGQAERVLSFFQDSEGTNEQTTDLSNV